MSDSFMGFKKINDILVETISAIEKSRGQLFDIVEHARNECENIKYELKKIREKVDTTIEEVDRLDREEKRSRVLLANVSKNFHIYDEDDIKEAYEKANDLRVSLTLKREEERTLIEKRGELEIRLKETIKVLKKAEDVSKQIGVATGYLKGNADDILATVGDLSKKQYLGIKIIEAQEEERQRLARDIHDGPAQSMANILVKAQLCERLIDSDIERTKKELESLKDITRSNLKDVRKIIYDLRPMTLDDLGLIPTLERYIYNFMKESSILVELKILGDVSSFESAMEIAVFRIIQEALNNVQKHSHARKVDITVEKTSVRFSVLISDDGVGFNKEEDAIDKDIRSGGFGLMSMKERAELLNGKLKVKSSPGMGTKIYFSIPLNEEEDIYER
ncbi:sensor histidine kinase [Anaerosalibacter massiliensis]|uniref:Oxygen sensor histidine kinase NreB n=1 Tax=Anaerosalibacter massiliensis TaxID=1347392 RepID=A0A9X2MKS2_9FIRM|nr:sensor histidine kinase [Anaerosalibacter massiliensis]MCR2043071.1 sensor histidine kinase [Anaerosalibacter massiliensis]